MPTALDNLRLDVGEVLELPGYDDAEVVAARLTSARRRRPLAAVVLDQLHVGLECVDAAHWNRRGPVSFASDCVTRR